MKNLSKLVCSAAVVTALALPMSANAWWGPWNNNGWGNNGWGNNNNGYGMGDFLGDIGRERFLDLFGAYTIKIHAIS